LALDNKRVSLNQFGAAAGIDSTNAIIACFAYANSLVRNGLVSTVKNAGCTVVIEPVIYSLDTISTSINVLCNVENLGGDFVVPLAYAGILEQTQSRPKKFKIRELEALEYMSVNDLNASKFLTEYTEKFLIDNNLISYFDTYKNKPNQANHLLAKEKYWDWAKSNTAIKGTNPQHTYRVFNKIFNVYCYKNRIPGEDGSNVASGPCPYSFLIYNRTNFRDENLPSGMTRREYLESIMNAINTGGVVRVVLLQKTKEEIKKKYGGISEIQDSELGFVPDSGVHIHHILPQHSHPMFALYKENLIALTPGQHLSFAHVQGNTQKINPEFQRTCLKKKFDHIQESLNSGEEFYILSNFIQVMNSALELHIPENAALAEVHANFSFLI
jgi:hypothetical protein